jgi:hypothetical protein
MAGEHSVLSRSLACVHDRGIERGISTAWDDAVQWAREFAGFAAFPAAPS